MQINSEDYIDKIINGFKVLQLHNPTDKYADCTVDVQCMRCGMTLSFGLRFLCEREDDNEKPYCTHRGARLWKSNRLKNIYRGMRRRCLDPKNKDYCRYGAKGITICDEWLEKPWEFQRWAFDNGYSDPDSNTLYKDRLSIDRKDPTKGYSPENCQWVSISQNSINKSIRIKVDKYDYTLVEWSKFFNCNEGYFTDLLRDFGYTYMVFKLHSIYYDEIKVQKKNCPIIVNGISKTMKEWTDFLNLPLHHIKIYRLEHGEEKLVNHIQNLLNGSRNYNKSCHYIEIDGVTKNVREWADTIGGCRNWLFTLLRRHGEEYVINYIRQRMNGDVTHEHE